MSKKHPQTKQADTSAKERLSGLARSFDDDATALASETLVADTLKIAVGYWLTYPMCFKSIMANPGVTFDQKYLALRSLDTAHSWAVRYLMREAASHGLDGANLWEGGRVCRELHEINPPGILMRLGAIEGGQWSNCLGDTHYKLPQAQQDAIRDGDAEFMSLMNVIDFLPNGTTDGIGNKAKGKGKRGRKPDPDYDPNKDRRLCEDWKAAKRQGTTREAFARGKGISVNDLIAAQNREKYRRQRDAE